MIYNFELFSQLCYLLEKRQIELFDDSREVTAGSIFVLTAPASEQINVSDYARLVPYVVNALEKGAGYIVLDEMGLLAVSKAGFSLAQDKLVLVKDVNTALGTLAAKRYKHPHLPKLIGITGTNGKTTSSYLIEYMLQCLSYKVGVLGTVSYRWPGVEKKASLTTPSCLSLHRYLYEMAEVGVDYAILEVSSHALSQKRVAGLRFTAAMLTNVTQDHLDYHGSMESYFAAKAQLFSYPSEDGTNLLRIVNFDDPYAKQITEQFPDSYLYSVSTEKDKKNCLYGELVSMSPQGMELRMEYNKESWTYHIPLSGYFNAQNVLGVQSLGLALGLTSNQMKCLESFPGVPGRLQMLKGSQGAYFFIDFAHTPDALSKVLLSLGALPKKRIITLFGCGGNRDKSKRPLMGKIAAELSDIVIISSDNPRSENAMDIIHDIIQGIQQTENIVIEADRREAIALAVNMARNEDIVLIAGRGHELTQEIRGEFVPFSDLQVLKELLTCE